MALSLCFRSLFIEEFIPLYADEAAWSTVLPQELKLAQGIKNFPAFCGTRSFVAMFVSVRHRSLSLAR